MSLSEQDRRKILFTPCTTKKHFHSWVKMFLVNSMGRVDLPDCTVSEESNSNPLDNSWGIYDKIIHNDLVGYSRIMTYSSRGSFKCNRKGTKLLTPHGLINIEDAKVGDTVWSGWGFRKITDWIHDGIKSSVKVTLEDGSTAEGSPIHRWWTWSPGGLPTWKVGKDLTPDDFVMVDTQHGAFNGVDINQDEFDVGYLCGILQGDGGLSLMDSYGIVSLTGMPGPAVDFFLDFCAKKNYNVRTKKQFPHSKATTYSVSNKKFNEYLRSLGLTASRSWEKTTPKVWKSKSRMVGFVTGLFDTDGSISSAKNSVIFALTARKMVEDLQIILRALGVNSQLVHLKLGKTNKHPVSVLTITAWQIPNLLASGVKLVRGNKANEYSDVLPEKDTVNDYVSKKMLRELLRKFPKHGTRWNKVKTHKPKICYKNVSRAKCLQLVEYGAVNGYLTPTETEFWRNVFKNKWVRVRNVDCSGTADFYDLTVEQDHSYWSDGLISHNTLSAAALEVMVLLHTRRNVGHMAAIAAQSQYAANYVKDFFRSPLLREFVVEENATGIRVVRLIHNKTGEVLTLQEYKDRNGGEEYIRFDNFLKLIICTMAGANSTHVEAFFIDEVDVVPSQHVPAYHQAQNIPDPRDGLLPVTVLTSTRKYRTGLVQKELDDADRTGLQINHWNIIDVTKACDAKRHKPELPKQMYYVNDDLLKHITQEEYDILHPGIQKKWIPAEGFSGCRKCVLFPACKSRLATHQTCTSPLLKPIDWVISKFKASPTPDFFSTEYLCRKVDSTGLVYPRLSSILHKKTAAEMAKLIDGEDHPETFTKADLIELLRSCGAKFFAGLDWGFIHPFAVVVMALLGETVYVLDCYAQTGLELDEQAANSEFLKTIYHNPPLYPDMALLGSIKTFKTKGYNIRSWDKKPFSVKAGIEIVRSLMWSGSGRVRIYFLSEDTGVNELFEELAAYKFKVDSIGEPTEEPIDLKNDRSDAMRYGIMNALGSEGALKEGKSAIVMAAKNATETQQKTWLQREIQSRIDGSITPPGVGTVRKGRFIFDS